MNDPKKELQYVHEVELAIQSLSAEDWMKIELAAFNFAKNVAINPEWLKKEALTRTLDGRRRWPPKNPTPFLNFLCGTMKSIRSEVCQNLPDAIDCYYANLDANHALPDEQLIRREREEWAQGVINATLDHFSQDDHALAIIMGKADGLSGEEIRYQKQISRKQYDAALKRISRFRNANYPRGNRDE